MAASSSNSSNETKRTNATATTNEDNQYEQQYERKQEGEGLSLDDVTGNIKLTSKDKKEFDIEKKHAFVSTLIKTTLDTDTSATEVPIPGVNAVILTEVITYMNHHKGVEPPIVEKPLRSKVMKDVCKDPFDADFIDRIGENRQALYDLILAANYMDIKSLLHLGCAKVASLIKGQPLEKIKDILSTGSAKTDKTSSSSADASEKTN
jgi:S-phase kinase-associated protein 1